MQPHTLSSLILALQSLQAAHGDLPVRVCDTEGDWELSREGGARFEPDSPEGPIVVIDYTA